MGSNVYERFIFFIFDHSNFKGAFFIFFICLEQFKGLWVRLLILYTLSSNPIWKGGGLTEKEVINTLNVLSLTTLPYCLKTHLELFVLRMSLPLGFSLHFFFHLREIFKPFYFSLYCLLNSPPQTQPPSCKDLDRKF